MTITSTFAGVDQPDVAALTRSGVFYRCYVWRNVSRNTIAASIFVEHEHGQSVELNTATVRDVETENAGDTGDCPKLIAVGGRYFIALWLENRDGLSGELRRAIFDVDDVASGWVDQGAQGVHDHALYDVDVVRGGDNFVVARSTSATDIVVAEYESPYTLLDLAHSTTMALTHASRVLGVAATENTTMIAYQGASNDLRSTVLDTGTGSNQASGEVFADAPETGDFANIGLATIPGVDRFVVMGEYLRTADSSSPDNYSRTVIYKEMNGDATSRTSSQYCRNLHMVSRPWVRASGFASQYNVFALVGFKSIADGQEWDQTYGYVINLQHRSWSSSATVGSIRPLPVSAFTNGSFDGRPSANSPLPAASVGAGIGRRTNHVSHVSLAPQFAHGPDVRSVTIAALHWEKIIAVQDADAGETQPAQASVRGIRFYHLDPWTVRLDDAEPDLPTSTNFRGVAPYAAGQAVETASGLVYGGGVLTNYDGRQLVENGFCWVPEILSATSVAGVALGIGDYWYTVTATWPDSRGQAHRSRPARPVLLTTASAGEGQLRIRPINLTVKDNRTLYPETGAVSLEVWRTTLVDGQPGSDAVSNLTFRRVYSGQNVTIQETPVSDYDNWVQTIGDTVTDDDVASNDLLPWQLDTTTLQWSPATPIPTLSARVVATWNNRLWIVTMDDELRYSDEILPIGTQPAAPEFFANNIYTSDMRGITAMQPMDDELIIFTETGVYALRGSGNDGTGFNANLQLQVVSRGTGCIEPRSVVLSPAGVMFQARKGYYMLSRALQLNYLEAGAAVEDTFRRMGNIRAATLLEDRHQIRIVGNDAPQSSIEQPLVVIFDYLLMQWSTVPFQNISALSSRLNALQGGCAWLAREGEVCHVVLSQRGLAVERSSTDTAFGDERYDDASVAVPLDIQTEWIHVAGLAGLKRVWEIGVMTDRRDAGEISVDAWYDFVGDFDDTTPDETFTFASPAPGYLPCKPRVQKFTSVMLRIYESGTVPTTENVRLVGLTMNVGIKKGMRRVPAAQYGA